MDIFVQIWAPSSVKDDPQAEYDYVSETLLPRMEDEFGKGVEVTQREPASYEVNVERVAVEA